MWSSPRLLGILSLSFRLANVLPACGLSTPKDGIILPPNANLTELIQTDPSSLVNLFIGTTNGGHSFPGATIPHGMIKVGMDTDSPGNQAGYDGNSTFNATGFSQLHDQGTGGGASLSNFKLWPIRRCHTFLTCTTLQNDRRVKRKVVEGGFPDDAASPGFFSTNLTVPNITSEHIHVELTATRLAALHRYTFPPTSHPFSSPFDPSSFDDRPRILVDISDGQHSQILPFAQVLGLGGFGNDGREGRVIGGANFMSSFGPGRYDAFVCVDWMLDYEVGSSNSSIPNLELNLVDPTGMGGGGGSGMIQEYGAYVNRFPTMGTVKISQLYGGSEQGILLTFAPNPSPNTPSTILARVGVSFISTDKACSNAESEIPDPTGSEGRVWDFDGVKEDARRMWNDIEVLGGIKVGISAAGGSNNAPVSSSVPLSSSTESASFVSISTTPRSQSVSSSSAPSPSVSTLVKRAAKPSVSSSASVSTSTFVSSPGSGSGPGSSQLDKETVELFYSSLYRTHLVPADYTGENPLWDSAEPYFDSFYCNWDTFRTLYPLYSITSPELFSRIVRSMIDIQVHEGWLPECRGATTRQFIQGGSNADPILGEFGVKYANFSQALNVSLPALFNALVQDSEAQSPNWDLMGRQANIWKSKNYLPIDVFEPSGTNTKQVSRALEYAFGDFSTYQVAKILGNSSAETWAKRSMNFVNNWNADLVMPGEPSIKGFMQPRFFNGTFNFTDPRHCSVNDPLKATCFLNAVRRDGFYESSPVVYSQFAPHDVATLVKLQGGPKAFNKRLDFIFENNYYDSTDEPSFNIPFMYHYVNQPASSVIRARNVINSDFNNSVNGLPGNDDSGAMASYVTFILAGLYPVPSTRQYLIVSPFFPSISFTNTLFNATVTIVAKNFNGNPTSQLDPSASGTGSNGGKNIFVKSVSVDGTKMASNCYLDFDVFEKGGVVELEMTSDKNVSCGNGSNALPPSLSTGGL